MPMYEYKCSHCGKTTEKIQPFDAEKTLRCECGKTAKRIVSRNSFALKGKGWYKDHYGLKK